MKHIAIETFYFLRDVVAFSLLLTAVAFVAAVAFVMVWP